MDNGVSICTSTKHFRRRYTRKIENMEHQGAGLRGIYYSVSIYFSEFGHSN